jgi:2-oxoisovalerate dehydrogenase E2 component (dihydrolipoyl transacylase)
MAVIVKMPQLGESIVEGTIARWLKAPGDPVAKFEPLLEISTDKIDTEIPSPASGILLEIMAPEGKTVRVGSPLAHIGEASEQVTAAPTHEPGAAIPAKPSTAANGSTEKPAAKPSGRDFVSPVVARIANEHNITLAQVSGTGAGGRVTKKDVLAYIEQGQNVPATDIAEEEQKLKLDDTPQIAVTNAATIPHSALRAPQSPDEFLHPLTAMRRAIAQHMVQSKQTSPHVTTIFEVDMNAVVQHREVHKRALADKGIHLTYTAYFVAAVATALRAVPQVNSRFSDEGIIINRRIHIGVAVALPDGLIVPVIRDADEKNLQGLARAVNELADQARAGKLPPDASKGGTFTITNHGVGGSLVGTPIINQPQAGILGIGVIVKRPVVRSSTASLLPSADDALVIRPMCYLSFSFDHRILDGAKADEFLTRVKQTLENWKDN